MKIRDIAPVLDPFIPVWVNIEDRAELFDTVDDIPQRYYNKDITYITTDANNKITIEV